MASRKRTPYNFYEAYCAMERRTAPNGKTYIWADGRGPRAETELKQRLELLMIKRSRAEIWKDTPPKTRQVIRLDVGTTTDMTALAQQAAEESNLQRALEKILPLKVDAICDNVVQELCVGERAVVWVLTRESVEIMANALEKAAEERDVSRLLKENKTRLWATHGEASLQARRDVAAEFREHKGAGVIVATMDSMPEGISLLGASTEHFAQMHYLAGTMFQAENRPYAKEVRGLHILYYIAIGTVDERVEQLVLPRVKTLEKMADDSDAIETSKLFGKSESIKDIWKKLFAGMNSDAQWDRGGLSDSKEGEDSEGGSGGGS